MIAAKIDWLPLTDPRVIRHTGELVGGLDIVREMKESGELDAVLKPSSS